VAPTHAQVIVGDTRGGAPAQALSETPPPADDTRWHTRPLAQDEPGLSVWHRVRFDWPSAPPDSREPTMLHLPCFFGGGPVLINGTLAAEVPRNSASQRVRGEHPFLLPLPADALKAQGNKLLIQAHAEYGVSVCPRRGW
jgi:hypothetical protein